MRGRRCWSRLRDQMDSFPNFKASLQATSPRIAKLQAYFESQVLRDDQFICSSHESCRKSHRGTFYAGQLPHIGEHYDLERNGYPFRIVVVGQEYGTGPEHVDLVARRTMIVNGSGRESRFPAGQGFPARNPHMKGCTSVLRLLFGKDLGSDREGEFLALDGVPVHLFDCFALVNFLLCSAIPLEVGGGSPGAKPGRSTATMHQNCARHFKATLEILEPTIIVLQGRGVLGWMRAVLEGLSDDVVQTVLLNGTVARVLAFTHPSAYGPNNWGINDRTPYLCDVVAPAVRRILCESV